MKSLAKLLFLVWGCLVLLTGCSSVPGFNSVHVTSNPSGAQVYNACGVFECGTVFRGFRPYDHVQGTYRGETPVSYPVRMLLAYDNVRVVWPDGEDSGWEAQGTGFWKDNTFHFTKRSMVQSNTTPVVAQVQSSQAAVNRTSERLAVLKDLREKGDITEGEYLQGRKGILDSLSSTQQQPFSSQSQQQSNQVIERPPTTIQEHKAAVTPAIAALKNRFAIAAHIEDDPAKGDSIMGNGDGLIQKGEAFDLVVVISNVSTSAMKDVTCTVTLPPDKSLKAYSELHYAVSELEPAASATNRINLAIPMIITTSTVPTCIVMVKEAGDAVEERLNYELPMDLELTRR